MVENQTQNNSDIAPETPAQLAATRQQRRMVIVISIVALIILALVVVFFVFLFNTQAETASRLRDIFIIFMALESIVIGAALIILMIQLATLINLLQNEIKPILNSTNETVNTVRGTVVFLSDNLAEPVIKLNEYLAGFKKVLDLFRLAKK